MSRKEVFIIAILILGILAILGIILYYPEEEIIGSTIIKKIIPKFVEEKEDIFDSLPSKPLTPPPKITNIFQNKLIILKLLAITIIPAVNTPKAIANIDLFLFRLRNHAIKQPV